MNLARTCLCTCGLSGSCSRYVLFFFGLCSGYAGTCLVSVDRAADLLVHLRIRQSIQRIPVCSCGFADQAADLLIHLQLLRRPVHGRFLVHAVNMLFALRIPWKLLHSPWKFFLAVSPTRPSAVSRLPNVAGGMNCCARHLVSLFLHAFASELGNGAWISLGRWRRSLDTSVRGSFALPSTLMGEGLGGCRSQSCHGYLRALLELVLPSNHLPPS